MRKKIEIVNGDGSEIDISKVSSHITSLKPKTKSEKSKEKIIVPEKKNVVIDDENWFLLVFMIK